MDTAVVAGYRVSRVAVCRVVDTAVVAVPASMRKIIKDHKEITSLI